MSLFCCFLLYFAVFNAELFYSAIFYSSLSYSILFYSTVFRTIPFYSVLFYYNLSCYILFCSNLSYSILFCLAQFSFVSIIFCPKTAKQAVLLCVGKKRDGVCYNALSRPLRTPPVIVITVKWFTKRWDWEALRLINGNTKSDWSNPAVSLSAGLIFTKLCLTETRQRQSRAPLKPPGLWPDSNWHAE